MNTAQDLRLQHPGPPLPVRRARPAEAGIAIPVVQMPKAMRARQAHLEKGRHLARQERWDALAKLIRTADRRRLIVSDGTPVAELLAEGARADVMEAAREAIAQDNGQAACSPIDALAEALEDDLPDTALTLLLALAHMDMARAWCGTDGLAPVIEDRHRPYFHHLTIAARLVADMDAVELDSPLLASLRCELLASELRPKDRVTARYDVLVKLAPQIPAHLRAFGRDLLPRRFGNYDQLDAQAREVAQRTETVWGRGGYVWMYLDALSHDSGAFRKLDADLFLGGIADILDRAPDQHTINVLAAFTGYSMASTTDRRPARRTLADAFDGIVRDHLREIHTVTWADATRPVSCEPVSAGHADHSARGRQRAFNTLEQHFAPQLQAGLRVRFTDAGPEIITDSPLAPAHALG